MKRLPKALLCSPDYFEVSYSINEWMDPGVPVDRALARRQWSALKDRLQDLGLEVLVVQGEPGLPDMVFAADCGLFVGDMFWVSNFHHPERRGEAAAYASRANALGFAPVPVPAEIGFEGLGDVIVCPRGLVVGRGPRSSPELKGWLERQGFPIVAEVSLAQARFYHTANVLACLDAQTVLYYPEAFDQVSRKALGQAFSHLIEVDLSEAAEKFACNCVTVGSRVLMGGSSERLDQVLRDLGWQPERLDVSEFEKSGAGVRCLVMDFWTQ